ncbi:hypothetical protein BU24DRAFT_421588 [Aaosphaeria arxii CBS 175.79]|uniref:Saccharopine dehydrogenase NADP binding domain-containing protein n=1 Tax=Aaosphaeria arxii CBS 175.79 TaxID=1450172 RepID=A0A6A5XQW4_9PLEO|nr:uncharacterized protein BU24DRAFT_421588 [Aaosphaeria arxii CBS 175.79]KAF2015286.1 hypothetical protein BU24DRAFT_421588 [Aaosphaeria arxii CBS 175.79]
MASTPRQYDLVLLGATGYTGKLTAEWVNRKLPSDIKWAIAGRNAKKLQSVADELHQQNPNRPSPAIETVELEKAQLDTLARKTRLIITTVGPYMFYGEPVLAACAENGTHYLDCTGEIPWYYDMLAKYHATAEKNGAIIIPQCGLDSVPADIVSYVVSRHIRKTFNLPTASLTYTLYAYKTGVSGGTSTTALNIFSNYSLSHLSKSMNPYSISPVPAPSTPTPTPSQSSLLQRLLLLPYVPKLGGLQTTGLMAAVDACLVHRSWGLYTSQSATSSYGPNFQFKEYTRSKSLPGAAIFKLTFALAGLLLAIPPTRWIFAPLLKAFVIPAPGEGPSKESMKGDFMSYRALGVAEGKKEEVLAKLDFAFGAYEFTGCSLAAAAEVLLTGGVEGSLAGELRGGILTPATLGEAYVEKLRAYGVNIEVGV